MTSPSSSPSSSSSAAPSTGEAGSARAETAALQDVLAAEHAAVWGYGTVGAALAGEDRTPVTTAVEVHRDLRDRLAGLITDRGADPVPTRPAYQLPFPVLSATDAARLAVQLEDGTTAAWVWVLDQAADRGVRELAVASASAAETRAVPWRVRAGVTPTTSATPGL
ncbi:DUF4439 domain-containing protein [Klenkia sp. PcliD-1-E]|uniref:ferritin-like domain-containing protein n=1 Tax=Klenkia sp. PcliD-1-E TaxID=2954492 RepID=UPI002097B9E8|nr:DUF4439 domain-containing protein [Klenkia sp. PcliD-1-E]MCO7222074.1 ferritin-like domain-containing protein [Klenkia sp. PcliD-1-E]